MANAPLSGRDGKSYNSIFISEKQKYFSKEDWTGQITVNLAERRLRLLTQHIDELRAAFRETRRRHPFTIDAICVLPDHLHTVWTLPEADADFAT
jgi:REP element-mobilizing transposase RayT